MLDLYVGYGVGVDDAIQEAVRIAKLTGHPVKFIHQEIHLMARADSDEAEQRRHLREKWARLLDEMARPAS